jgi:hypothetical protein
MAVTAVTGPHTIMEDLLLSYKDVFDEPHGLPPVRRQDHRIHLLPGSPLVAVRPYRYPQLLKDEIERQCECDSMLAQGIIRESTSPFSSPVLLVRKSKPYVIGAHICGVVPSQSVQTIGVSSISLISALRRFRSTRG